MIVLASNPKTMKFENPGPDPETWIKPLLQQNFVSALYCTLIGSKRAIIRLTVYSIFHQSVFTINSCISIQIEVRSC